MFILKRKVYHPFCIQKSLYKSVLIIFYLHLTDSTIFPFEDKQLFLMLVRESVRKYVDVDVENRDALRQARLFCFVFGLLTNGFHTKFVSSFFFSIQKGWGLGGYSSFRLNKGRPNFLSQDHPPDK